jgi:hypothetical protein
MIEWVDESSDSEMTSKIEEEGRRILKRSRFNQKRKSPKELVDVD